MCIGRPKGARVSHIQGLWLITARLETPVNAVVTADLNHGELTYA